MSSTAPHRTGIPLTVIGGFLGAGKTTLLNRLLRDGDRRIAVLVNDFGAINIDADLVRSRDGETISLTNGCVCCGLSGELMFALAGLRDRDDRPDHVVVEASGIGDPRAIAAYGDMPGYARAATVVVADAETVRTRAAEPGVGVSVAGQLRAADLLVLSKTDLVSPAGLDRTRAWLRETVPSAGIVDASFGAVPAEVVLGLREGPPDAAARAGAGVESPGVHAHPGFAAWSWCGDPPLDGAGLSAALTALPDGVLRVKGVLHLREDPARRYVLQLAGRRGSIQRDRPWGDETPSSSLVAIGLAEAIQPDELTAAMVRLSPSPAM